MAVETNKPLVLLRSLQKNKNIYKMMRDEWETCYFWTEESIILLDSSHALPTRPSAEDRMRTKIFQKKK